MKELLLVNACVNRDSSRTMRLLGALMKKLQAKENYHVTELILENENIQPMNQAMLTKRDQALRDGDTQSPCLRYANSLLGADCVVVAAPYWDLSFPAMLKCFFEQACANGLLFRYNESGQSVGLCHAERVYYVSTSGGYVDGLDLGYEYVKKLCAVFGIHQSMLVCARGLDIWGNDAQEILQKAEDEITL